MNDVHQDARGHATWRCVVFFSWDEPRCVSAVVDFVDMSHVVEHGMVTYPGLPAPVVSDWLSRDPSRTRYSAGTTFQMGKVEMLTNTGTNIDARRSTATTARRTSRT